MAPTVINDDIVTSSTIGENDNDDNDHGVDDNITKDCDRDDDLTSYFRYCEAPGRNEEDNHDDRDDDDDLYVIFALGASASSKAT